MPVAKPVHVSARARRPKATGVPAIFGKDGSRTVLLATLAINRHLHVRDLARQLGKDSARTFRTVEHFERVGLCVKQHREGSRKYVMLDRSFAAHFELRGLLLRVASDLKLKRVTTATHRHGLPTSRSPRRTGAAYDHIFGSPTRTRSLLLIAACGEATVTELAPALGLKPSSVWHAINHFEREGMLQSRHIGRERRLSLSKRFRYAKELHRMLSRMIYEDRSYRRLADALRGDR